VDNDIIACVYPASALWDDLEADEIRSIIEEYLKKTMSNLSIPVLIVTGPVGAGKSSVALAISDLLNAAERYSREGS
jgi:hypothetical protein